jgi:predicted alternative tryptophan synthase beta-subunit
MKIEKVKVGSSTRKLSANYTVDLTEEVEHIIGDELQKAIDEEILNTIVGPTLVEEGWTQVMLKQYINVPQEWLDENLSGRHSFKCFGYYWYFENEKDATMFSLKWC